ncbi:MAG: DNA gyrase inhibitor YacG [Pseudomonadota bacterium]
MSRECAVWRMGMTQKTTICPVCQGPGLDQWRPFCSKRCSDVDLGRWMTGHYRIASPEPVDPDDLPETG